MSRSTNPRDYVDVFCRVLDHQLVDCEDWPCGTVDELEVEGEPGTPLRIVAMRVGPGAWAPRLPALLARLAPKLAGTRSTRVPW